MMMWGHKKRRKQNDDGSLIGDATTGQKLDVVEMGIMEPITRLLAGGSPLNWGTAIFAGVDMAVSAGTAKRGQATSGLLGAIGGQTVGLGGYYAGSAIGGVVGEAVLPIFGAVIGAYVGGAVGALAGDVAGRTGMTKLYKTATRAGQGKVQFGGYEDTQPAYNMRQKAERELSSSLLNARRYLGQEAQLFHQ